ncbi:phage tail tube protein [Streptomyces olivaceoviridis]|uniref:phage tail tube protein n=1 Tax=Streptomyces olivaceoviridis TaxID=1921 RepID=UPI0036C1ABAA
MARFNRKGVTKILFAETIASTTYLPTAAEMTGATDYTKQIAAVDGFSLENQEIETPDMASTFVSKIPGDDSAADSSLTFYEDDVTDTIETDLAKGTTGFIIICRKGKAPSTKGMDVYPVRVASNSAAITADNEAAKIMVKFSITDRPLFNATVPTGP